MQYSYLDELEEENQTLRKTLWYIEKGIPKSKDRASLYDSVLEHLLSSKSLRNFCRELEENQDKVDLRDIKVNLTYQKPTTNRYVWRKNKGENSYTREDQFEEPNPYEYLRKRKLSKSRNSNGDMEIYPDE